MTNNGSSFENAPLATLGHRLEQRRLARDLTQATLAREAGVSKSTIERLENGASVQLANLVRVLRALELLDGLDRLVPEPAPRPMELLAREGKRRRRASSSKSADAGDEPWTWDDES